MYGTGSRMAKDSSSFLEHLRHIAGAGVHFLVTCEGQNKQAMGSAGRIMYD